VRACVEGLAGLFEVTAGGAPEGTIPVSILPFIAYLPRLRHYVTVWTVEERRGRVLLGDPAAGLTSISIEDFLSDWDGIAVVLRPREQDAVGLAERAAFVPERAADLLFAAFGLVFSSGRSLLYGVLAMGVLAGAASTGFSASVPYLLTRPSTLVLMAAAFVVVSGILAVATTWLTALAQRRQPLRIGGQLTDAFDRLDHGFYTVGDYYSRFGDTQGLVRNGSPRALRQDRCAIAGRRLVSGASALGSYCVTQRPPLGSARLYGILRS